MKTQKDIQNWVCDHLKYVRENGLAEGITDILSYAAGLYEGYASAIKLYDDLEDLPDAHLEIY